MSDRTNVQYLKSLGTTCTDSCSGDTVESPVSRVGVTCFVVVEGMNFKKGFFVKSPINSSYWTPEIPNRGPICVFREIKDDSTPKKRRKISKIPTKGEFNSKFNGLLKFLGISVTRSY